MADKQVDSVVGRAEPDIFETDDLPEADQQKPNPELESESVEKLNVSVNEAYKQFKDKAVYAENTDFSDRISGSRRTGYYIPRSEYELLGEGDVRQRKETPEQKLQRLQLEVKELSEDISKAKEDAKASVGGPSTVSLSKQVECLNQQLKELNLDKQLGEGAGGINMSDPHAALHRRLLAELDAYKARDRPVPTKEGGNKAETDADHMTFKLFYRPEQTKFSNSARVADLEQRIDRMEALLGGQQTDKLTVLTSEVGTKHLLGIVSSLVARVKLLDPGQLELVESRLSAVNHRLNQLAEKKEGLEKSGKLNKVSELYDLVTKWDSASASLPSVVDRLTLLKDLHEQALMFGQTLSRLEATQQQIEGQLKTQSSLLKQVDTTVSGNLAVIQTNCDSLSERMKALNK